MLTVVDIKDFLKTLDTKADFYYIGKLDSKKDKAIGIYNRQSNIENPYCINHSIKSYQVLPISILIHYNHNAKETDIFSYKLYEELLNKSFEKFNINNYSIKLLRINNIPIDVGSDDNGIYERVIECDIFYDLKEA